jgi:hypothetical protein
MTTKAITIEDSIEAVALSISTSSINEVVKDVVSSIVRGNGEVVDGKDSVSANTESDKPFNALEVSTNDMDIQLQDLEISADSDIIGVNLSLSQIHMEEKSDSSSDNDEGYADRDRDLDEQDDDYAAANTGNNRGMNNIARLEVIHEGDEDNDEEEDSSRRMSKEVTGEEEKNSGEKESLIGRTDKIQESADSGENETEPRNRALEEEKEDVDTITLSSATNSTGQKVSAPSILNASPTTFPVGIADMSSSHHTGTGKTTPPTVPSGSARASPSSTRRSPSILIGRSDSSLSSKSASVSGAPSPTNMTLLPKLSEIKQGIQHSSSSAMKDKEDIAMSERSEDDNASDMGGTMNGGVSVASDGTSQSGHLKPKKRRPTLKGLVKRTKSLFGKSTSSNNLHEGANNVVDGTVDATTRDGHEVSSNKEPGTGTAFASPTKQNIQALKSVPSSQLLGTSQGTNWDDDLGLPHVVAKDFDLQSVSSMNTDTRERDRDFNPGAGVMGASTNNQQNHPSTANDPANTNTNSSLPPSGKKSSLSFYGVAKGVASFFNKSQKEKESDDRDRK